MGQLLNTIVGQLLNTIAPRTRFDSPPRLTVAERKHATVVPLFMAVDDLLECALELGARDRVLLPFLVEPIPQLLERWARAHVVRRSSAPALSDCSSKRCRSQPPYSRPSRSCCTRLMLHRSNECRGL